jgi:hypothetical protein
LKQLLPDSDRRLYYHPRNVQIIAQMCQLDYGGYIEEWGQWLQKRARPEHCTITVRYTDWWDWEENKPLELRNLPSIWRKKFKLPNSLKSLTFEFETRYGKRDELDEIVSKGTKHVPAVQDWSFQLDSLKVKEDGTLVDDEKESENGRWFAWDRVQRTETYVGSAGIGKPENVDLEHHQRMENGGALAGAEVKSGEMLYYIVKLRFVPSKRPSLSAINAFHKDSDASTYTLGTPERGSYSQYGTPRRLDSFMSGSPSESHRDSYFSGMPPPLHRRDTDPYLTSPGFWTNFEGYSMGSPLEPSSNAPAPTQPRRFSIFGGNRTELFGPPLDRSRRSTSGIPPDSTSSEEESPT